MMNAMGLFHLSESKVRVAKAAEDFAPRLHTERQSLYTLIRSSLAGGGAALAMLIHTLGLARSSPSVAASELLRASYSVDDNKQYTRRSVQQLLCVLSLVAMWKIDTDFRTYASMAANCSLDKESRNVQQVHMKSEHMESTNYDPVTSAGYEYEKIDDSSSKTGRQIEITRRFFGLSCPESKLQKTLKGLLLDYDAACRINEAELAFAHDHFFTGAASAKAVVYPVTTLASVKDLFIHTKNKSNNSSGMALTAVLIMLVLLALELLQLYLY
uniref:DUF4220 domain-containing protein n=1 Tax=Setaria italica TaxID=4555 RepID=K4A166_SETIT